jgi:hypothetical protein
MRKGFKNKYHVVKIEDVEKYLSEEKRILFNELLEEIDVSRNLDHKSTNTYLVVNTNERYAEKVFDLIMDNSK